MRNSRERPRRQLLFLASLLFVTAAVADDKIDTKELDKPSANMSTTATDGDYNNSRSNNLDGVAPAEDENDVDEAVEYQDGEDLVLRKRPGR